MSGLTQFFLETDPPAFYFIRRLQESASADSFTSKDIYCPSTSSWNSFMLVPEHVATHQRQLYESSRTLLQTLTRSMRIEQTVECNSMVCLLAFSSHSIKDEMIAQYAAICDTPHPPCNITKDFHNESAASNTSHFEAETKLPAKTLDTSTSLLNHLIEQKSNMLPTSIASIGLIRNDSTERNGALCDHSHSQKLTESARSGGFHQIHFPLTEGAKSAIHTLVAEDVLLEACGKMIELKVDENESSIDIVVMKMIRLSPQNSSHLPLPIDQPRFCLLKLHPNQQMTPLSVFTTPSQPTQFHAPGTTSRNTSSKSTLIFIFSCASLSTARMKMVYSAARQLLVSEIQELVQTDRRLHILQLDFHEEKEIQCATLMRKLHAQTTDATTKKPRSTFVKVMQ